MNPRDIKSIRYVFMNKVILYEMRKTKEEVFGNRIIEVAPEAFEHEGGVLVMETYRKVAEEGGEMNLGLVEYSNEIVGGIYKCSVHFIKKHYVYVLLNNVTELESAKRELKHKKELERKNKELEQFTYITSHDLQEPLNSIISFSTLLEREKDKMGGVGQKSIEVIKASANRMRAFIIALLEYSTIGREKEIKEVIINNLCNQEGKIKGFWYRPSIGIENSEEGEGYLKKLYDRFACYFWILINTVIVQ